MFCCPCALRDDNAVFREKKSRPNTQAESEANAHKENSDEQTIFGHGIPQAPGSTPFRGIRKNSIARFGALGKTRVSAATVCGDEQTAVLLPPQTRGRTPL